MTRTRKSLLCIAFYTAYFSHGIAYALDTIQAEKCRQLLTPHVRSQVTELKLPPEYVSLSADSYFQNESLRADRLNEVRFLIKGEVGQRLFDKYTPRMNYSGQYLLLTKMMAEPEKYSAALIEKYFPEFKFPAASVVLDILVQSGEPVTEDLIRFSLEAKNSMQGKILKSLMKNGPVNWKHFLEVVGPRLNPFFPLQQEAITKLVVYNAGDQPALLEIALAIENKYQVSALETGLREYLDGSEMVALIPKIKNQETLDNFLRKAKLSARTRYQNQNRADLRIRKNQEPKIFTWVRGGFEEKSGTLKSIVHGDLTPGLDRLPSREWFSGPYSRYGSGNLNKMKDRLRMVYMIYERELARRKHFNSDFIRALEKEDEALDLDRYLLVQYENTDRDVIGTFGLYDGRSLKNKEALELPCSTKRPQIKEQLLEKIESEFGALNDRKVFEVRRLALHHNARQVSFSTVMGTTVSLIDSMGASGAIIVGHTDSLGKDFFSSQGKMRVLFGPEELGVPDEYILAIDIDSWRKAN